MPAQTLQISLSQHFGVEQEKQNAEELFGG